MEVNSKTSVGLAAIAFAIVAVVAVVLCRSVSIEAVYPIERTKVLLRRHLWSRVSGAIKGANANAENMRLKREIASLVLERGEIERLELENTRLRMALGYAQSKCREWVPAEVMSERGAAGIGKTIRVNKGSLAGIAKNAPVMVQDGLIGIVTAVTPHTADVTLITDPMVKVSCRLESGDGRRILGVLCGGDEDMLRLRHITGNCELAPRTTVSTSGLGGIFPRGLKVGFLISTTNHSSSVEGDVLPAADLSVIEDVFIRREK